MSVASLLSSQSAGSILSHQCDGSVLSHQANNALRGGRTDGRVPAGSVPATVAALLVGIGLWRARRRSLGQRAPSTALAP